MAETSVRYRNNFRSKKCDLTSPKIVQLDIVDESPPDNLLRNGIALNDCCDFKGRDNDTDKDFFHLHIPTLCNKFKIEQKELVNDKVDPNLEDILSIVDAKDITSKNSWITNCTLYNTTQDNLEEGDKMKILNNTDSLLAAGISDIFSFHSDVGFLDESVNKSNTDLHSTNEVLDLLSIAFQDTDNACSVNITNYPSVGTEANSDFSVNDINVSYLTDYRGTETNKTELQVTSDFSDLLSTIKFQDDDSQVSLNGLNKLSLFSDSANFSIENIKISDLNEIHYKDSESHKVPGEASKADENLSDLLSSICVEANNTSTPSSLDESFYFSDSNISPDESSLKSLSNEKCDFISTSTDSSGFSTASSFSDDTNFQSGVDGKFINLEPEFDEGSTPEFSFFNTSSEGNFSLCQLLGNGNASSKSLTETAFENHEISEKDITMLDLLKAVNFESDSSDCCGGDPKESVSSYFLQCTTEDEILNNIDLSACIKTTDCPDSIQILTVDKNTPVHNKDSLTDINQPIAESAIQADETLNTEQNVCSKIANSSSFGTGAMFSNNFPPSSLLPESSAQFSLHLACSNVPRTNLRQSLFSKALSYKHKKDVSDVKKVSSIKSEYIQNYLSRPFLVDAPTIPPKTNISFSDFCVLPFLGRRVYGSDISRELP